MSRRSRRPDPGGRRYPREARLNELLRQIVAEELDRIGDPVLEWVSVTEVTTDRDLTQATVLVSTLDDDHDDSVLEALEGHRRGLQDAINAQARVRRTPPLTFRIDETLRSAQRIDDILAGLDDGGDADDDEADGA